MPPSLPALQSPPAPTTRRLHKTLAMLWAALCVLAAGAMAMPAGAVQVPVPPYSARVLDTTGTLGPAQIAALNGQILALEADTHAAVVVFMLPTTGEESIEEYATRVFEAWKPGDAARDDGILVLVALQDRRMRIEVGQGLEGSVPDVLAGRIIDGQMMPRFRDKDYAGGLEAAIGHIGALVRGDAPATVSAVTGGVTPFGWAFLAALLWGFAVGAVRAHYSWKWPVTAGVAAAVPLLAAAVLREAGMAAILLSFPAPLAFALGFGCGRSRVVRLVAGGFVLVIGLLAGIGYAVGADRFWWGFLYAMAGGVGCLLLTLIAMGMRMAWKRSLLEFCVRSALVIGIVSYVAFENPPGSPWTDWESWLPTGLAAGLAMLFGFFPGSSGGGSGGSGSGGGGSSGSSSSSSSGSSSSSRSSSGGSSSGGGASGSW